MSVNVGFHPCLPHSLVKDQCCCTHERGWSCCRVDALWQAGQVCCEPLTPLMPLLDLVHAQPDTAESMVRLLKATAEGTLLLRQEHLQRLAGGGLFPTSAELQDGIPRALWGMGCDAAPSHHVSVPKRACTLG